MSQRWLRVGFFCVLFAFFYEQRYCLVILSTQQSICWVCSNLILFTLTWISACPIAGTLEIVWYSALVNVLKKIHSARAEQKRQQEIHISAEKEITLTLYNCWQTVVTLHCRRQSSKNVLLCLPVIDALCNSSSSSSSISSSSSKTFIFSSLIWIIPPISFYRWISENYMFLLHLTHSTVTRRHLRRTTLKDASETK